MIFGPVPQIMMAFMAGNDGPADARMSGPYKGWRCGVSRLTPGFALGLIEPALQAGGREEPPLQNERRLDGAPRLCVELVLVGTAVPYGGPAGWRGCTFQ